MRSIILEIFSRASFSEKLISILFLINRAQHTANYLSMHHKKSLFLFARANERCVIVLHCSPFIIKHYVFVLDRRRSVCYLLWLVLIRFLPLLFLFLLLLIFLLTLIILYFVRSL